MGMTPLIKYSLKRTLQFLHYIRGAKYSSKEDSSLLILMYHRILPKNDPRYNLEQPGMIVEPETFHLHLKLLKKHFTITSISKWLETPNKERPAGISCAISFDDGWSDNYTYAYPYLKMEHVPATIFLVSELIGTTNTFWPEKLANILSAASQINSNSIYEHDSWSWINTLAGELDLMNCIHDRHCLDEIINKCKELSDSEINKRLILMQKILPIRETKTPDILNWDQIINMKSEGLIDFGSHTQNHMRMNKIDSPYELQREIRGSKDIIENKLKTPINIFCYPNGDVTEESDKIVRKNYRCAVTTMQGINLSNSDPYMFKRIGIHQDVSFDEISFLSRIYKFMRR